jgi:hypothetical protein
LAGGARVIGGGQRREEHTFECQTGLAGPVAGEGGVRP